MKTSVIVPSRPALLLGLLAIALVPARAASSPVPDAQVSREGRLPANLRLLAIEHRHGPVTVVGADADFGWTWKLEYFGHALQGEEFIQESELKVEEAGDRVGFRLVLGDRNDRSSFGWLNPAAWFRPNSGRVTVRSTLELRVPRAVAAGIRNQFGRVTVRTLAGAVTLDGEHAAVELQDLSGPVTATTSFARLVATRVAGAELRNQHGDLEVNGVAGDLKARTSFASLKVTDVSGRADLRSEHGRIEAAGVQGNVRAQNSFGPIVLAGPGREFEARNEHGSIEIAAGSAGTERIDARASFGSIEVSLPRDSQPLIRAAASFGKVRSDFPVMLADSVTDEKFAAAAGRPKLTLEGEHGDVRIRQLAAR